MPAPGDVSSNVIPLPGLSKRDKAKSHERWSDAVMDRGHTTILFWGQAKLGLTPDELNVLLQIISHWWYAGNDPHPSKDRIGKRMKKHPRTVQAYLTSLEDKGFIRRVERFKPNRAKTRTPTISVGWLPNCKPSRRNSKRSPSRTSFAAGGSKNPPGEGG